MKRFFLIALILLANSAVTYAQQNPQQDDICSPEYINIQMTSLIETYITNSRNAETRDDALATAQILDEDIQALLELCANVVNADSPSQTEDLGNGTLTNPYKYGYAGDTGEGFSLRVLRSIRPADQIILRENMFNDRPQEDQEYIIIELELQCDESNTGRCESNYFDFELAGDSGTIYESSYVVYSNEFDVSAFGGGSGTGGLVFMVRKDDTNLRLLYRENMFSDGYIAYEAEPSVDDGIRIQANTNLNIRSEPNTGSVVVGSLSSTEPVIAIGRNGDGTWLQIGQGWVFAELVTTFGDIETLPVTSTE